MKTTFKSILALGLFAASVMTASAQKPFKLQGTVTDDAPQKYYVYLADADYKTPSTPTDSMIAKKGKIKLELKVDEFRPMFITSGEYQMQLYAMPGGKCNLTVSKDEYWTSGDKFYQQFRAADEHYTALDKGIREKFTALQNKAQGIPADKQEEAMKEIMAEAQQIQSDAMNSINAYTKEHGSEEGAVVLYLDRMGPDQVAGNISDEVKNGQCGKYINHVIEKTKAEKEAREKAEAAAKAATEKTAEGVMFTDFSAEYDGKTTKLSDFVGKGKYILVDFWASWCGPCKAEIPNIISCWEKHHGDKFDVLGVATWDKPEATLKAIEQLHIPYQQMLNAQRAGSDAYGIQGIPQIILFGPDGTILKRDLRGDAIEATVSEYLSK